MMCPELYRQIGAESSASTLACLRSQVINEVSQAGVA